ncbi:TasA family protein [Desulfosporosinus sp. SYSU MS00001]|uniref:TasA family protein n=1 Tax=Desulfosporosinus sp. SYSU MS00001 TaxID=3416284 RepID=UPI003CE8E630
MKKRLLMLIPTSVMAVSLLVGAGTYALFTNNATNTNNNFTAGTVILDQQRDLSDTVPGPMFYSANTDETGQYPYDTNKNDPNQPPGGEATGGWAPGDKATRAMNVYNRGTLKANLDQLKATVHSGATSSGAAYDEFISKMNIKVLYPAGDKVLYDGPLSGLLNDYVNIPHVTLTPNPSNPSAASPANITFKATMDPSANNLIQGQSFVFDFTVHASQARNNP